MPTRQPKESRLYVRIAKNLRTMIEDGRFQPGDKLPPATDLAKLFECSLAVIREAEVALCSQGLVVLRRGRGAFVRTAALETWMEPLDAAVLLGTNQVVELVELLTVVLAGIAGCAAQHSTTLNHARLAQALFRLECSSQSGEDAITAELLFYTELADCAGNALLGNSLRVLQEAMRSSLRLVANGEKASLATCRLVHEAVQKGDAVSARQAVYEYGSRLTQEIQRMRRTHVDEK